MLSPVLAFLGALIYGGADFLGGMAARRMRSIAVTAVAATAGLIALLTVALPIVGGAWHGPDVLWGVLSGVSGVVAVGLLYACLAIGPMSILSPLTAVVSAIAPMLWGLASGDRLELAGYLGLAVAVIAVVLVGFVPGARIVRPSTRGLVYAVGSGLAIGAMIVLLDQTSDDSGVVALVTNRIVNAAITWSIVGVLMLVAVRAGRPAAGALIAGGARLGAAPSGHADLEHAIAHQAVVASRPDIRAWLLAIGCGLTDTAANVLLLIALRTGDLAVVGALTALYPAGTIVLAALVLRERIAAVQWIGLVLAVAAGALLAIG